ncbi:MAG: transposase [Deferrisomatales bacterium]|nr:transposase [Deferrisomatales bacterium]
MTRKQYTKEFKLEALKLAEKIGVPRAADDLGVGESLLYRWRKAAQNEGEDVFRGHGKLTERDEELRKLRQEVKTLTQEREILKKATAFFASLHR